MLIVQAAYDCSIGERISFTFQRFKNDPQAILSQPGIILRRSNREEYIQCCINLNVNPKITFNNFYEISTD